MSIWASTFVRWCHLYFLWQLIYLGSFIYYVRQIFPYSLIRIRTCVYQGVRNVSFSENFAMVIHEWSLGILVVLVVEFFSLFCRNCETIEAASGGVIWIKMFLKILQNSHGNTCARVFLNKVAVLNFIKKRLWHRCFPVNFANFLKNTFSTEHLRGTASETICNLTC